MLWIRNRALSRVWCAMAVVADHHAKTWCLGSIDILDAFHFDVLESPPHDDRCSACVRELVERRRIEIGLAELTANATFAEQVARACGADPDCAGRIADVAGASLSTVARWANGTLVPHAQLQARVLEALTRPAARAFEMFDYSDVDVGGLE